MINVIEITIKEFKDNIYEKYIELFPDEEQRDWEKIRVTYNNGIEKFYAIVSEDTIVGFFMLEKIKDYPYYLDYFGIFKQYQNKGYGSLAIKELIKKVGSEGLIGEIEKEDQNDIKTIKRFEFYKRLGFRKIDSEYYLYKVYYTPIECCNSKEISKERYDEIFFDYYKLNCGEDEIRKKCKIIK